MRFALTAFATLIAVSATAVDVVFDERSPKENCAWVDKSHVREQMVVVAEKICKVLYGGTKNENIGDDFTITLYPMPEKKGNPGFASGRRVTWHVGTNPDYDASNGIGLLAHEMTHVLDLNARPMAKSRFAKFYDAKFVEATAVWVTDYNVKYGYKGYRKCTSPEILLDRRYEALRNHRSWGGYRAGAGFFDFVEQTYGKGTALKLIREQTATGKKPWERVLGKTMEELEAEWRQMETIYDPVFQWNYNGTAAGAVRFDKNFCGLRSISAENAADRSGAWLNGATSGNVAKCTDGNMTLALHGRFPKSEKVVIASLGAANEGNGKTILVATTSKPNLLAAHVVATIPGQPCQIVSTTPFPIPHSPFPVPHSPFPVPRSLILSVKGGDEATVIVDGKLVATIDMKSRCGGCAFLPSFAVGGMAKGVGVAGFTEPRGKDGVLLDDVRVFTRAFRPRETSDYAKMFGPDYRGAVAVEATWCGPQGGREIDNPGNWVCFNAYGEKIVAIPSKETEVTVWFRAIPSIPLKSKFECKSFTIDGIAVADEANVDLRRCDVQGRDRRQVLVRDAEIADVADQTLLAGMEEC